jgi:hypothetical protein
LHILAVIALEVSTEFVGFGELIQPKTSNANAKNAIK